MAANTTPVPTNEEIGALWKEGFQLRPISFARAVLTRWGAQPAPAASPALTHTSIAPVRRFLADRAVYLSDETTIALITVAHGIKEQ